MPSSNTQRRNALESPSTSPSYPSVYTPHSSRQEVFSARPTSFAGESFLPQWPHYLSSLSPSSIGQMSSPIAPQAAVMMPSWNDSLSAVPESYLPHQSNLWPYLPDRPSTQPTTNEAPIAATTILRSKVASPQPKPGKTKASFNSSSQVERKRSALAAEPTSSTGAESLASGGTVTKASLEGPLTDGVDLVPGRLSVEEPQLQRINQPGKLGGRMSREAMDALAQGHTELDDLLQKIVEATGLDSAQILQRWRPSDCRPINLWNIYQKYFQVHAAKELGRLPGQKRRRGSNSSKRIPMNVVQEAYKVFCKDEPNHERILKLFWRIEEIGDSNTTLNSRSQKFQRYTQKLKRLADSASTVDGFETVFGVVGAVVHQDQSLSTVYCSRMVPDFFSDRLRIPNDELEGHLKAHVYDRSSQKSLMDMKEHATAMNEAHVPPPTKKKSKNEKLLLEIKRKFCSLTEPCNIPQLQQSKTPFTHIPKLLAQSGWVLENWPEDVPFPCDIPTGKGIASLPICHREPLLLAFDHPHYPLRVVRKYPDAVPSSEPVVVGVPPPPGSKYSRARRKFLDKDRTEDRKGPARLTDSTSVQGQATANARKRSNTISRNHVGLEQGHEVKRIRR
ncbi:hypothetical protein CVT26_002289 [Gymnopilus dilepis]|uniref:Uncharacterized protein n=1 Tax=Gymnopilus dilepis TaxID=231916 RepID=A0A409YMV9_9AGAR|nr:hypothetical protein CVT26_002289 [Gymnopilus dilepis]